MRTYIVLKEQQHIVQCFSVHIKQRNRVIGPVNMFHRQEKPMKLHRGEVKEPSVTLTQYLTCEYEPTL